jgi:hypothetical protein
MTEDPFTNRPQLMSAVRARDLGRLHKAYAASLREAGDSGGARLAEQESLWWLSYAIALSQIPPGRTDDDGR